MGYYFEILRCGDRNPLERIDEGSCEKLIAALASLRCSQYLTSSFLDVRKYCCKTELLSSSQRGFALLRSLGHYSYIMGCLNRWHCSILINYLTAYIWLLRHLVNGLQQGMSNPILQLERFTNL